MFKHYIFLLFLVFFYSKGFSQFISLEACNESSSIASRNTCFKSYIESLLLNAFEENKSKIKLRKNSDKLTLEVLVDESGNFRIIHLDVKNIGLYKTTQKVIENLLPISPYKNFEGTTLYDTFNVEIDFPLNENIAPAPEKNFTLQTVEKSPVFPGCYTDDKEELRACMSENIKAHIANNFSVFLKPNSRVKKGNQRINIQFKINKNGFVDNIKVKAKYKELEEEAIRVIKALPKMTPGKKGNIPVDVTFLLPMTFNLR
ncbi:MAG: energy transducer TonB [Aequorivita antarctica]